MVTMDPHEFEALVGEALDAVPEQFMTALDNVVFLVEDDPPPDLAGCLGVYDGVPATERPAWGEPHLPDRITIFRNPTLEVCASRDDVREEILVTVVHELGHYYGMDEDRLHELGWG
ncbi:MAG: metallopeptidase family protein [Austwickia sp.]|nr:metallopeptidase family protein [Austwickia sp.]MBK8435601.1 metallopeptidase family protein [Austwickia sp.]MBK9100829.1 metallopeptidase family protein [Austwickia sp.]